MSATVNFSSDTKYNVNTKLNTALPMLRNRQCYDSMGKMIQWINVVNDHVPKMLGLIDGGRWKHLFCR